MFEPIQNDFVPSKKGVRVTPATADKTNVSRAVQHLIVFSTIRSPFCAPVLACMHVLGI